MPAKIENDVRIINVLRRKGPMSAEQIAAELGLSRGRTHIMVKVMRADKRIYRCSWKISKTRNPDTAIFDIGEGPDVPKLTAKQKQQARVVIAPPPRPTGPVFRDESVVAFFGHYEKV